MGSSFSQLALSLFGRKASIMDSVPVPAPILPPDSSMGSPLVPSNSLPFTTNSLSTPEVNQLSVAAEIVLLELIAGFWLPATWLELHHSE
jgi:hypothetical protein